MTGLGWDTESYCRSLTVLCYVCRRVDRTKVVAPSDHRYADRCIQRAAQRLSISAAAPAALPFPAPSTL